jgi:hypothetical protein
MFYVKNAAGARSAPYSGKAGVLRKRKRGLACMFLTGRTANLELSFAHASRKPTFCAGFGVFFLRGL